MAVKRGRPEIGREREEGWGGGEYGLLWVVNYTCCLDERHEALAISVRYRVGVGESTTGRGECTLAGFPIIVRVGR